MNIVTIKAKAQLAATKLKDIQGSVLPTNAAEIIESCFTPDSATSNNLLEALQALKACKEELHEIYKAALGPDESDAYREADRILDKYPKLI